MNYLIILLSLLFFTQSTEPDPKVMSISAEGQIELTADIIQFNINLNAVAEQPQKAYEMHKQREKALVQLLKKYDVQEKNIQYEPISISRINNFSRNEKEVTRYQTRQSVSIKLDDFDIYEKIQIGLIENNFDSFSGQFMSSESEQGKDEALKKAIKIAKEKAQLIAQETGVTLGEVHHINYNHNVSIPMYRRSAMEMQTASDQLMQFEPTVTVSATVSIDFVIAS
jgi:uncharacterized protein YggE